MHVCKPDTDYEYEVGRKGMTDEEIIPFLHKLRSANFFTRDLGFYKRQYCHSNYCLIVLAVGQYEVASFIRRFLRHPHFDTKQKRIGRVIRLTHNGIKIWKQYLEKEEELKWYL